MPASIVVECVLCSEEATAPESCLVTIDPDCQCLCIDSTRSWDWCYILVPNNQGLVNVQGEACNLNKYIVQHLSSYHEAYVLRNES